jgi:UDP-glucose 4-epimerase
MKKKYNVLITGGLGLIGSHIAKKFSKIKSVKNIICLDNYGRYTNPYKKKIVDYRDLRQKLIGKKLIIERGDIKYDSVIFKVILKYKPKYIFHLASLPLAKIDNLNSEEALEGTVVSTAKIIEAINVTGKNSNYKPERFVYASSSMVYGDFLNNKVPETHQTKPKEIYGSAKLAGEIITKGLCNFYKINFSIIRPSAVYGPTDMNNRVSQIFIDCAMNNQTLNIMGKDEKLDFTYIEDIVEGFYRAATNKNGANNIFNITCGNSRKLLEYANILKKYFPDLKYKILKRDDFRPVRGTLSIQKANKLLNYKPRYNLEKGIEKYIKFKKIYN